MILGIKLSKAWLGAWLTNLRKKWTRILCKTFCCKWSINREWSITGRHSAFSNRSYTNKSNLWIILWTASINTRNKGVNEFKTPKPLRTIASRFKTTSISSATKWSTNLELVISSQTKWSCTRTSEACKHSTPVSRFQTATWSSLASQVVKRTNSKNSQSAQFCLTAKPDSTYTSCTSSMAASKFRSTSTKTSSSRFRANLKLSYSFSRRPLTYWMSTSWPRALKQRASTTTST